MSGHARPVRDGALRVDGEPGRLASFSLLVRNKAFDVAKALRERGKRMPLPDEYLSPAVLDGETWVLPRWTGEVEAESAMVTPKAERIAPSLTLRDYQQTALRRWWRAPNRNGVIEAPCGSGKTAMGIVAMAACETPGLVLVHTRDLLNQWAERCASAGLVAEPVAEGAQAVSGRVVVATMQTVSRWSEYDRRAWGRGFGLVVVDEAHHVPCGTLAACLYDLPGAWRLGLTATPDRTDGLTPWMYAHLGPSVAVVDRGDLVRAGAVVVPVVHRMRTGWDAPEGVEYVEMVSAACDDPSRTGRIVEHVAGLVHRKRRVMVLTERKGHANEMHTLLAEAGVAATVATGDLTAKVRARNIEAFRSGSAAVLVATQLADEGLDVADADALVLAAPARHPGRLEQRVGRVCRPADGKPPPEVYDFVDGGRAASMWWSRLKVYRRIGCTVVEEGA